MKKIILWAVFLGLIVFGGNVFAIDVCTNTCPSGQTQMPFPACNCIPNGGTPNGGGGGTSQGNGGSNPSDCPDGYGYTSGGINYCCPYPLEGGVCPTCPADRIYTYNGQTLCCPGTVNNGVCENTLSDVGININPDCLLNGQCSLNVYKVVGIRQSNENPTVLGFFQDITLATTTVALGTFVVVAMVLAGLYRAIASVSGKDTKKPKTIFVSCFMGMLLVMGSYAVIRLIQFLATAGS